MATPVSAPQLVVLAAGLGRRFGGLKQLTGVGPGGATLLEYSLFDARQAGFGRVTFVIRPEMQGDFRSFAEGRLPPSLEWNLCLQRMEDVPPGSVTPGGRRRPWGTAHAVLAAESSVSGPFGVVNADDFYGREAFHAMASFLASDRPDWALVGYELGATLSPAGGVNRGLLALADDGTLASIEEVMDLVRTEEGAITGLGEAGPRIVNGKALVSMNFWGLEPSVFGGLRSGFRRFLEGADIEHDEYPLPVAMQDLIQDGERRIAVLASASRWFGVTYHEDLVAVRTALEQLVASGHYPERLWS